MNRRSPICIRFGLAALCGGFFSGPALAQDSPTLEPPTLGSPATPVDSSLPTIPALPPVDDRTVKPTAEGPLHEAFLSPSKDRAPQYVDKAPPNPINERPAVDPPSDKAVWIPGYWEWNSTQRDYVWTTGTWRNPPPGRFWVNSYWKRDDKGWYRVPGFWTDRQTDRIDWRKNGPPTDRPADEPGASPGDDFFYVPAQYFPDGDGVTWKKGYWAKAQAGWSWVPAQWIRQPEGWTFQDGYWDRTLEDRGTLFAPAQVTSQGQAAVNTVYQPLSQVAPEQYGQLYGAFGRPNSNYDGYPGYFYDNTGRYYGYANYGNLGNYSGYLDYPYVGGYGYPYYAQPVNGGYGYGGYGGYGGSGGYGGYGGFGGYGGYGYGNSYYGGGLGAYGGYYGGLGFGGYGGYGGLGFGGFGLGLGFGGFGASYYGFGLGAYPGYYGGIGYGGFGLGLGFGGYGYGGYGYGGYGYGNRGYAYNRGYQNGLRNGLNRGQSGLYPNQPGRTTQGSGRTLVNNTGNRTTINNNNGIGNRNGSNNASRTALGGVGSRTNFASNVGNRGVMRPASSNAYANPFHAQSVASGTNRSVGGVGSVSHTSFNGVHQATVAHSVARPSFGSGGGGLNQRNVGLTNSYRGAGNTGAGNLGGIQSNTAFRGNGAGMGGMGAGNFAAPRVGGAGLGNAGFAAPHIGGGYAAPRISGGYGGGMTNIGGGSGVTHIGGYSSGGHMGGYSGGHVGGFSSGGHVGGGGGGHVGGGGGGHGGGGGGHR